jgi:hypothetical protein
VIAKTQVHGPTPPSHEQLEERHAAALITLRNVFGEVPIQVATAGEPAGLVARIPADTPLLA